MQYIDVSDGTWTSVGGPRRYARRGTCIHTTMGWNSLEWLQKGSVREGRPASADLLIARNGNIYQITRPGRYAFHTGTAAWGGYDNRQNKIHQVLLGVELECAEQVGQRITDAQYIALAAVHRRFSEYHEYPLTSLTTHAVIALPPGRKKDPIFFDNNVFQRELSRPSREGLAIVFPAVLP